LVVLLVAIKYFILFLNASQGGILGDLPFGVEVWEMPFFLIDTKFTIMATDKKKGISQTSTQKGKSPSIPPCDAFRNKIKYLIATSKTTKL